MKYMLLIHQVDAPTPPSEEWERLSEDTARQLMRQQLTENALRGPGSLEYRVPPECRDGGRLDLDPDSTRFP